MNKNMIRLGTAVALALVGWTCALAAEGPPLEILTLEDALRLAGEHHPRLAEARAREAAAAGRTRQAGLWPNPSLTVGAEQVRTDPDQTDTRESVAGISQQIPLGGRAGKARDAARQDQEAAARDAESIRLGVEREVRSAYATALYQQMAHDALAEGAEDHRQLLAFARARLEQGELALPDLAAIEMAGVRLELEWERSREAARLARESLALALGDPERVPASLSGGLEASYELPALEELARDLERHPDLLREEARERGARARIDLARAERIPDVDVGLLFRRHEATGDRRLDLGLSLPLPLFDRNQGRIAEARADAQAAREQQRRLVQERRLGLREAHQRLREALAAHQAQVEVIMPGTERILQAAEARTAAGELSRMELLTVRLEGMRAKLERLESLRDVMQAWADLSLLGKRG